MADNGPNTLYFVPVTGTYAYRDAVESPAIGERVVFTPRSPAYDNGDGRLLLPKQLVATLDTTGSIPADFGLPAPGSATPFYYDVTEDFAGGRPTYTIEVYASLEYIDLPTVVPYEDEIPGVPYGELVAQIADLTARVTELEESGGGTPSSNILVGPSTIGLVQPGEYVWFKTDGSGTLLETIVGFYSPE